MRAIDIEMYVDALKTYNAGGPWPGKWVFSRLRDEIYRPNRMMFAGHENRPHVENKGLYMKDRSGEDV